MPVQLSRRTFLTGSSAAVAAVLVGAKLGLESESTLAQDASQLIIGSLEEPGSLSALVDLPHHFPLHVPQTLLFDSLTQFLPDSTIAPKLATAWTISEDSLTYTFTLNPAAKFHDGTPITADDVKFTFDAMADPTTNSSNEGVENVASVEVIDPQTVTITLSAVTPTFLGQGGARGIVPKHVLDGKDIATDPFNQAPVGSGPYRFVSYTPGEALVLESVPDHYRGVSTIQSVAFKIISDQNVLLSQLGSGEIGYGLLAPKDLAVVEKNDALTVFENQTPRFFDITPNYARSYWQDQAVRAAILQGIDRDGIVRAILLGHGMVIDSNVTPASWAYSDEGISKHPYDPDAASAALDAAGWTREGDGLRSKGGEAFSFGVMTYTYDATLQQALLVAQQNLADIGVKLDIEIVESGVFGDRRSSGEYDALARIWNPVYDPDQAGLLRTGNFYGYTNPDVDKLATEGLASLDQEKRLPIYLELGQLLSADLPRLFLYTENELHGLRSDISGIAAHPINVFWNLPTWTIGA